MPISNQNDTFAASEIYGRISNRCFFSSYRIGPFEVESALIEHPAVGESAVVPSPDVKRGQVVKAFVVLTPQYRETVKTPEGSEALVKGTFLDSGLEFALKVPFWTVLCMLEVPS